MATPAPAKRMKATPLNIGTHKLVSSRQYSIALFANNCYYVLVVISMYTSI